MEHGEAETLSPRTFPEDDELLIPGPFPEGEAGVLRFGLPRVGSASPWVFGREFRSFERRTPPPPPPPPLGGGVVGHWSSRVARTRFAMSGSRRTGRPSTNPVNIAQVGAVHAHSQLGRRRCSRDRPPSHAARLPRQDEPQEPHQENRQHRFMGALRRCPLRCPPHRHQALRQARTLCAHPLPFPLPPCYI